MRIVIGIVLRFVFVGSIFKYFFVHLIFIVSFTFDVLVRFGYFLTD